MSKAKGMNWLEKVGNAISTGINKYNNVCDAAEKAVMTKCGSERMIDNVVEEKLDTTIIKTKQTTTKAIAHVRHTMKESTRVQTVVVKTNVCVSAAKEKITHAKDVVVEKTSAVVETIKDKTKKKSVPMCRPISHIDGSDAPMSGVPQSDKAPAPMTIGARMNTHAQRGVIGVPMVVCK